MALLLDTGAVYALYDRSDDWHRRMVELVRRETGLTLPAPVLPEIDHLLASRLGRVACRRFYEGLAGGHYLVEEVPREGYSRILELDRQFEDLAIGFVDAAVVTIAESLDLRRIATTDRRHFVALSSALSFELLP